MKYLIILLSSILIGAAVTLIALASVRVREMWRDINDTPAWCCPSCGRSVRAPYGTMTTCPHCGGCI